MATSSLLPSFIGNIAATRQRLANTRQQLRLEPNPQTAGKLQQLAPSPPTGPAMDNPGTGQTAVATQPQMQQPAPQAPAAEFNLDSYQVPDEKRQMMLAKAQEFIDRIGPQQQQMIEQERAKSPGTQIVRDPKIINALSPLADFFKKNGRLPNPEELRAVAATRVLTQELGREPNDTEVRLYLAKPAKGV